MALSKNSTFGFNPATWERAIVAGFYERIFKTFD